MACDLSQYYIDFSNHDKLTIDEKNALEVIQRQYRPLERVTYLMEYKIMGKITADEYETMTGVPYEFG